MSQIDDQLRWTTANLDLFPNNGKRLSLHYLKFRSLPNFA